MWDSLKRLALGLTLLAAASGVLLLLNAPQLRGSRDKKRVAILQHASTTVLDEAVEGVVAGLAERGWVDGQNLELHKFNPQGDISASNDIARRIVNGGYDLVLTSSTPSLQAVASANRAGLTIHIFGLVADPYAAGVGLSRDNPAEHPPYMAGYGIEIPIAKTLRLAKRLNPGLKRVGMIWNPGEANSQAVMRVARQVCPAEKLELLEASAENTSAVAEACNNLVSRGAQVIVVGGDITVSAAIDVLIATAAKGDIPVITALPDRARPQRGTLADLGADFFEAGKISGELAGDVLNGADPKDFPIRDVSDVIGERVYLNLTVLPRLKESWRIPEDERKSADIVVDDHGVHRKR
jgi:ABC-type uncharacterized transport system substrate-binding protein